MGTPAGHFEHTVRTLGDLGRATSDRFIFTFRQPAKNIVKTAISYYGLATFLVNPVGECFLGPCPRTLVLIFSLAARALIGNPCPRTLVLIFPLWPVPSNPDAYFPLHGPCSRTLVLISPLAALALEP